MGAMQRARANSRVARRRQRSAQHAVDGLPPRRPLNDLKRNQKEVICYCRIYSFNGLQGL